MAAAIAASSATMLLVIPVTERFCLVGHNWDYHCQGGGKMGGFFNGDYRVGMSKNISVCAPLRAS
eukprot:133613-Pelagomonas_calceolata.AAC.1